jgi:hypothetical protein
MARPRTTHTHTPSRVKKQHDNTARIYTRIVDIERWRSRGKKEKKQERSRREWRWLHWVVTVGWSPNRTLWHIQLRVFERAPCLCLLPPPRLVLLLLASSYCFRSWTPQTSHKQLAKKNVFLVYYYKSYRVFVELIYTNTKCIWLGCSNLPPAVDATQVSLPGLHSLHLHLSVIIMQETIQHNVVYCVRYHLKVVYTSA